jgi:hypothetical protein
MLAAPDLARIRLVTARYHELNGLGRMGMGVAFVIGAGVWSQIPGETLAAVVAMATVVGIGGLFEWVSRRHYYEPRFGRVTAASAEPYSFGRAFGLIYGAVVSIAMIAGYPNLMMLAGAATVSVRLATDWRFRPYLAVDIAAGVVAVTLYGVRPHAMPVDEYLAQAFALIGASAMLTGLCDHLLLVRTLKPTARATEHEQPAHVDAL